MSPFILPIIVAQAVESDAILVTAERLGAGKIGDVANQMGVRVRRLVIENGIVTKVVDIP